MVPKIGTSRRRKHQRLQTLLVALGVTSFGVAASLVGSSTPSAAVRGPLLDLAMFAHCPVSDPAVATCLFSSTTSTTFQIGSTTVTSTSPTTLSLGLGYTSSGQPFAVLPNDGTSALVSPAEDLPGGLTGIPGLGGGVLAVTVTPQLVGAPTVSLADLLGAHGPGLTLPIDVLISTPTGILGSECTIADASDPITLNLTTGTTQPPPPNTAVTGSVGTVESNRKGEITDSGMTLVDNAFAVPGAQNCGTDGVLDEALDLDKGLPSPAGENSATLSGSSYTAPAALVSEYLAKHSSP